MIGYGIVLERIVFSLDATGAVTEYSFPVMGEVVEVRVPNAGTVWTAGTADVTLTREEDGGTVLAITNLTAPATYSPRPVVHSNTGGTTAYTVGGQSVYDTGGGMPVHGRIKCVVAQGEVSKSGTLFVYYRK